MKKNFFAFALIIAAFVSVTSGCYVGYGGRYHRYHQQDNNSRDHRDRGGYNNDYNNRGN